MKLVVTGGTGFIGSSLCPRLLEKGHSLSLLTRSLPGERATANKKWFHWNPPATGLWEEVFQDADGVINLAGEAIAARRWTKEQKRKIEESRIQTTHSVVNAIAKATRKPGFLINGSAVGYYGPRGDDVVTENDRSGNDFLALTCRAWEEEAIKAESLGLRVIRLRTGIVLGRGGGALAKMAPPFKFYVGGPLGSGAQWMPWIHLEDEVSLILRLVENPQAGGPINATAPNPVRMKEFCKTLGKVLHRPCWAPVPALALRLMLGEMSDMLLTGQRVMPTVAEKMGYQFRYPTLEPALQACMPL